MRPATSSSWCSTRARRALSARRRTRASSSRSPRRARSSSVPRPMRVASGSCSPEATASPRARPSARPCAGCWRALERVASAPRASSSRGSRPRTSRWSRPALRHSWARGARAGWTCRDRPLGLRLLGGARRGRPGGAARGGLARGRAAAPRARSPCARRRAGTSLSRSCAGRCSRSPRSTGCSTCAISRFPHCPRRPCSPLVALAAAPALVAVRAGRRLGLVALAAALLVAAWVAAGHPPSPGSPLAGLGGALLDAPSALGAGGAAVRPQPSRVAGAVLIAAFLWLAALAQLWLVRPRPLVAGLLALLPFAVSATVYDLPEHPWRALAAAALLLAFLRTGRPAGGGAAVAAGCAALALLLGAAWSAVPRGVAPGRAALDDLDVLRPVPDAAAVALVWDMGYQPLSYPPRPVEVLRVRAPRPSYWRAVVLGAFDGLRFRRAATAARRHPRARRQRGRAGHADRHADARAGRRRGARHAVPRRARPARALHVAGLGRQPRARAGRRRRSCRHRPPTGSTTRPRGSIATRPRASCARCPPTTPRTSPGASRSPASLLPPFGAPGREQELAGCSALAAAIRPGAPGGWPTRRPAPSPAAPLRRTRRSSRSKPGCGPRAPTTTRRACRATTDALARWICPGTAGYCQMFAASLAALARLSGVPARVAEGFVPGDPARRRLPRRPIVTRTPGSRPGSRATAGCRSTPRRGASCPSGHPRHRPRSTAPRLRHRCRG